jgi:hypothetical protein
MRGSSSCTSCAVGFDCSVMPQLKQLQAGGTPAYTAPEVVHATFNNTPLEAAVGPQVNKQVLFRLSSVSCTCYVSPMGIASMQHGRTSINTI